MRCNLSLRHTTHNFGHGHRHALLEFGFRLEKRIQHADALRDHRDFQLVDVFEVLEKLLECHLAIDLKSIPQSPLLVVIFLVLGALRLRECAQRQCEVDEAILVAIKSLEAKIKDE